MVVLQPNLGESLHYQSRLKGTIWFYLIQYAVASTPAMRLPPKQSFWQQTLDSVINSSGDSETGFVLELCAPRAAATLACFNGFPHKKFVETTLGTPSFRTKRRLLPRTLARTCRSAARFPSAEILLWTSDR